MPLSDKQKKAIAIGGVGALLLGLAAARAGDDDGGDDDVIDPPPPPGEEPCPPGFIRVAGPLGANGLPTSVCVPQEPPPPPPKPGHAKNYVGSGYDWPYRDRFPTEFSITSALNLLGYPVNPLASIISGAAMFNVREFQRDYNVASDVQTVDAPAAPSKLDTDGLVGKNTLRALMNAQDWTNVLGVGWLDIVALA